MIAGAHTIIFCDDAEAARTFFRDMPEWPYVDAHGGWLIFALPPGELALHPGPGWTGRTGQHELFLMCHDLDAKIGELQQKGVEFVEGISDEPFGRLTRLKVPGAGELGLYEPQHPSPLPEFSRD